MRGISAIIAVVLILLITVSLAAGAYFFLSMTMSQTTTAAQQGISQTMTQMTKSFTIEAVDGPRISIRNTGQAPLSNFSVYVDNIPVNVSQVSITPDEVKTILIYDFVDFSRPRELKVVTGTLAQTKIVSKQDSTLVGYWKFDEGSGTTTADSSGNGNDVNFSSAVTWTNGKFGKALGFDGTSTSTANAYNTNVDTTAGAKTTVEFWMYWNGTQIVMPFGWNLQYDILLWNNSGKYCFGFNTGHSDMNGYCDNIPALNQSWHHVVAIFYNGIPVQPNASLYVDGEQKPVVTQWNSPLSRTVTPKIFISGWGYDMGYKFNGIIDEVRIYNRALTPEEIWNHYAHGPV